MKNLIISKYNQLAILTVITLCASILLMTRVKITQSFYLLFLVWNIFLAAIPYGITFLIQLKKEWFTSSYIKAITICLWVLFLPNAPYIVSDFTHLRWVSQQYVILDAFIIGSFASLGLLYMVYSIRDMKRLFFNTLSRKQTTLLLITLCLLIGFGIYLGRFLRWNSWDILQNPLQLVKDITHIFIHPIRNITAWGITIMYATVSGLSIITINKYRCTQ